MRNADCLALQQPPEDVDRLGSPGHSRLARFCSLGRVAPLGMPEVLRGAIFFCLGPEHRDLGCEGSVGIRRSDPVAKEKVGVIGVGYDLWNFGTIVVVGKTFDLRSQAYRNHSEACRR